MTLTKRKRSESDDESSSTSAGYNEDGVDMSSALTTKKIKSTQSEDDEDDLANFIRSSIAKRSMKEGTKIVKKSKGKAKMAKGEVGGGSFQSMGLHPSLLRSLTLQGYKLPTPIQRLSIPLLLNDPPRDLVGMARTGSGKSLAFLVPLVHRLAGRHSSTFGARALILVPTRELAVQILRVGKELARGFWRGRASGGDHAGDKDDDDLKQGEKLRWGLVVGGEGMDEQFEMIANNPDVIIATPGRLLHLVVEMNLELKSVQYVVFDEADRLFEMGFQVSLSEILNRLNSSRQTILFSATLPKSLVEFAKAGLKDPKLVRLDVESKIGDDLRMAFFSVKQAEKDACLLALLRDVIKVPLADEIKNQSETDVSSTTTTTDKKRQQGKTKTQADPLLPAHQTLIFAATKHHVEYLLNLLTLSGYAASHIYGTLDQAARTSQMELFRSGRTNILIVTDVAARGIDIPVLGNVVNYDFPQGARVFVHRVGRTARAGRKGWAWSFVGRKEVPDVVDLEGFLGRRLVHGLDDAAWDHQSERVYTESLVFGTFPRERIDEDVEYIRLLDKVHRSLTPMREVMCRAQGMYERSKGKASQESYKRAKEIVSAEWGDGVHPVLILRGAGPRETRENQWQEEKSRKKLLSAVSSFRPKETVFEVGSSSKGGLGSGSEVAKLMRERSKKKTLQRGLAPAQTKSEDRFEGEGEAENGNVGDVEMADEGDIVNVFGVQEQGKKSYRDEEFYLSYTQKDAQTEKGYSLKDGASSFVKQAQSVAFDLTNDNGDPSRRPKSLSWDKKKKKFVQGEGAGSDNVKMVRTEGGTKLPASFRSGRFDEWRQKKRIDLPRVGEQEVVGRTGGGGRRFKHHKVVEAKPLDRLRGDYDRRVRELKKKPEQEGQRGEEQSSSRKGNGSKKMGVRRGGKTIGRVKNEIKTVEQIRKDRRVVEKRKAKNARPSRSGARGGSGKSARSGGGRRKVRR